MGMGQKDRETDRDVPKEYFWNRDVLQILSGHEKQGKSKSQIRMIGHCKCRYFMEGTAHRMRDLRWQASKLTMAVVLTKHRVLHNK